MVVESAQGVRYGRDRTLVPFGEAVLAWRLFRGLTQVELARRAGIPRPNLSDIERGRREVTLGTLRVLAGALDVRPGVLADGEGPGLIERPSSRNVLERIAHAVAHNRTLSKSEENSLAENLRIVMSPRLGLSSRMYSARRSERAWLFLRSALPKPVLKTLIDRATEKAGVA